MQATAHHTPTCKQRKKNSEKAKNKNEQKNGITKVGNRKERAGGSGGIPKNAQYNRCMRSSTANSRLFAYKHARLIQQHSL